MEVKRWEGARRARWVAVALFMLMVGALVPALPASARLPVDLASSLHPSAATGSILFIRNHNVWIAPAGDPAAARPLTTDGNADRPYSAPTMDASGIVYAVGSLGRGVAGSGDIVRLDRSGQRIGAPFRPVTTGLIYSLDVSPDGETLAFTWAQSSTSGNVFGVAAFSGFARSDGSRSGLPTDLEGYQPVFYDDDRVLLVTYSQHYSTQGLSTYQLGQAEAQRWFLTCQQVTENCVFPTDPDVSEGGGRLAATTVPTDSLGGDNTRLVVWEMPGSPPAQPTYDCDYIASQEVFEPSWSPDGDALIWQEADGIHIASGFNGGCERAFEGARVVLPGATWPSWSSAPPTGDTVSGPPADVAGVRRLAGAGRYDTAAAISRTSFPGTVSDVFIVTGENWPDALSAGPAAAEVDAPILPVQTNAVPSAISAEIDRLRPVRAWVIGGANAIADSVLDGLRARGIEVSRISGQDRYATASAVASRFFPNPAGAYYASGVTFADALGGGAAAAHRGWPLLLTAKDSVPAATLTVGTERIVLGGQAAISNAVQSQLGARRVAGEDRYATAAAIARDAFATAPVAYLATGLNFPDALAGTPAAARDDAPVLLAAQDCVTAATRDAFSRLGGTSRVVLGGTAAVTVRAAALTTC